MSIEKCDADGEAEIKWSPGTNNNAPLNNFIIQYQTALDESIWYTAFDDIPPKVTQQKVPYVYLLLLYRRMHLFSLLLYVYCY